MSSSGLRTDGLPYPFESPKAALKFAWAQLDKGAHRRLAVSTVVLSALSVADFLAVLMIAAVAAIVVSSFSAEWTPPAYDWLPFSDLTPLATIMVLGGGAVLLLGIKTAASWWLLRRVFLFMARQNPLVASKVYHTYLTAPFTSAQMLSRTQVVAAIGAGSGALLTVVKSVIAVVADLTLILLMVSLMLVANPLLFLASAAYFGLLAYLTSRVMGRRMAVYGREALEASLSAQETTQASVGFAPEIRLYGMAAEFGARFTRDELRAATVTGLQQVLFQAPRYVFEMGVLIGFVLVAGVAFVAQSPAEAAFTVALFTLTSVRLVPALQRMNGALGSMRLATAQTYALLPIIQLPRSNDETNDHVSLSSESSPGSVVLSGISYRYPNSEVWALQEVDLTIEPGTMVALVGRTGSGKSTLAGIIAGLVEPTSGCIQRGGGPEWRTGLAMVPQDVYLAPDSLRNNIALPVLGDADDDERIWRALELAQVADVVAALPDGLDTQVGEGGARFSGGEAQRLGLARALYRTPQLLILDEATSSLDAHTEQRVADAVRTASEQCTLVVIAHRLSTVRSADLILYLETGAVVDQGTFDYLVGAVPSFAEAASLQGLAGSRSPKEQTVLEL